ncbi:hypothetical protein K8I31_08235 [bacterium]|nr:hypothetical protein [bacterium]
MKTRSLNWNEIGFMLCLSVLATVFFFIASNTANAQDDIEAVAPAAVEAPIALGFADGTPPPRRERIAAEGQRPPRLGRAMLEGLKERNPELFNQAREHFAKGEHPREFMPEIMREFRHDATQEDLAWLRENHPGRRIAMANRDDAPRGPRGPMSDERGFGEGRRGRGPQAFDRGRGEGPRGFSAPDVDRGPRRPMRGFDDAPRGVHECPFCHRPLDGAGPEVGRPDFERGPRGPRGPRFQDEGPRGPRRPAADERGFGQGRRGEGPRGFGRGRDEGPRGFGAPDFERGPRDPRFDREGAGPAVDLKDIDAIIDRLEKRLEDLRAEVKE